MTRTIGKIRACCMGVTIFRLNANAGAQTQARIRRGKLAATLTQLVFLARFERRAIRQHRL